MCEVASPIEASGGRSAPTYDEATAGEKRSRRGPMGGTSNTRNCEGHPQPRRISHRRVERRKRGLTKSGGRQLLLGNHAKERCGQQCSNLSSIELVKTVS